MVKTTTLKNSKIYSLGANALTKMNDLKFPARAMFYIQKNLNYLIVLAREIDDARTKILERYGTLKEDGERYEIEKELIPEFQKELSDLFDIEQEVKYYPIKLDWLGNIELSSDQYKVLDLMIEEE